MKVNALGNKVILKLRAAEEYSKSKGGIYIADEAAAAVKNLDQIGEIISAGEMALEVYPCLKRGTKVLFNRYTGGLIPKKHPYTGEPLIGEEDDKFEYRWVESQDILAVFEGE